MAPPLLHKHHDDWFAHTCATRGLTKLTGATLEDAAAVCTQINGTGFTEEIEDIGRGANAFTLAVGRIAKAVLEQADIKGNRPERGSARNTIVVDGKEIKCNKLEATAILASDALTRPIDKLFGSVLDGDNTWKTEKDGEAWVRTTFSPDSECYLSARMASFEAAEALKPTALFHINAFITKNTSSSFTFPLTVVSEICVETDEDFRVETVDAPPAELTRGDGKTTIKVEESWPAMVRVRSGSGQPIALSVL
jgi:hypothetical protein